MPSMTSTRGSLRSRQSNCPCPTSSATTCRAPRCSSTSVNPPVDAPMSSAVAPAHVDRERVERMRELQPAASDVRVIGRARARPRMSGAHERAGLERRAGSRLHLPRHDQRPRPLTRRRETTVDEQRVEADLLHRGEGRRSRNAQCTMHDAQGRMRSSDARRGRSRSSVAFCIVHRSLHVTLQFVRRTTHCAMPSR